MSSGKMGRFKTASTFEGRKVSSELTRWDVKTVRLDVWSLLSVSINCSSLSVVHVNRIFQKLETSVEFGPV